MFDYLKKIKNREFEKSQEADEKPKKDKVFIIILIIFSVVIVVSLITGIADIGGSSVQKMDYDFQFSISDGVILGGITIAYIITRIRKGRK